MIPIDYYIESSTGYGSLAAEFIHDPALCARHEQRTYLAVHNHRHGTASSGSPTSTWPASNAATGR